MGFIILLAIAATIFFFWKQNKEKKTKEAAEMLVSLDQFGEVKGKRISDLQSVLGTPWMRQGSDNDPNMVIFLWNIGDISITAKWDKMDNEKIVYFDRSDRSIHV